MTRWRLAVALLLAVLVGLPLAWPLARLGQASAWPTGETLHRLAVLGRNTALLVMLVEVLAVPTGVLLAVLLVRSDLPGRRLFAFLLLLSLFVPLPLVTSGWQAVLGAEGFLPLKAWRTTVGDWAPWAEGLGPAAWVHAAAGLPWVVLLVSRGLAGVEPELEEDALLLRGPLGALWWVALPRAAGAVAAAMLWLAVTAATEITVTDVMQVRTFAEEVYTQFVAPDPEPLAPNPLGRAIAAALFGVVPFLLLLLLLARQAAQALPPGPVAYRTAVRLPLGGLRWPAAGTVAVVAGGILGVPLAGLVWRAGLSGSPLAWSGSALLRQLHASLSADWPLIARTVAVGIAAGTLCATLALVACWLARGSRPAAIGLLLLLGLAWVMPGPVVGLGLAGLIEGLLDITGSPIWLERPLWQGPSSLPLVWVYLIRLLPFAAAVLWPAVRLVPRPLLEASRLDGAGPLRELVTVVAPLVWRNLLVAKLAVAVLSLGELAAGKMVSTAGAQSYAEELFAQMHYGVGADLAARCLWLLIVVCLGAGLVARLWQTSGRP
jgi:iron(III) transport system permease protein